MKSKLRLTLPILATITTLSFFGVSQAANVCNLENSPPIVDIEIGLGMGFYKERIYCGVTIFNPDNQEMTVDYSWLFTGTNLDASRFDGENFVSLGHFFFTENAGVRCKATVTNSAGQSTKVTSRKLSTRNSFKRVFGTMEEVSGDFGGVSVADEICQEEAEMYDVPGQYKAWISDDNVSPATTFTKWSVPYINVFGDVFAYEFGHITGESTALGFPKLESGNPAQVLDTGLYPDRFTRDYIWTGTFWDGKNFGYEPGYPDDILVIMDNCDNWVGNGEGHVGDVADYHGSYEWTYDYFQKNSCSETAAFVCVEQ